MKVAEGAKCSGQVNAFFRWRNVRDDDGGFSMELRVASAEELGTRHFSPPEKVVADVTIWRIQSPRLRDATRVRWRFGEKSGEAVRDAHGALTIPRLELARSPKALDLL